MTERQVLIVEDDNIVVLELRDRLQSLGYAVCAVASYGEEAIEKTGEIRPALVLMDIRLKGAMDGIEAAAEIRDRFGIPVVFLTAYADEGTLQRAKATEPYGYIIKPFQERELYTAIEVALYKHEMERKLRESERWLATTLRSIGDAVIAADEKGLVTFMNPVAEALTGWEQEEALGKDLTEVFNIVNEETRTLAESPVTRALREGMVVGLADHSILVAEDGREILVDDSAAPIRDDKGNFIGVVLVFRDIAERKQAEAELAYIAIRDSLTGLPNRVLFNDRLSLEMAHSHRNGQKLAVMYLDLDYFKEVNDTLGRSVGDQLLRVVADRLTGSLRRSDTVARMGGDEFLLLLPEMARPEDAAKATQRILQAIRRPFQLDGHELCVTSSIGIALYPDDGEDADTLVKNADIAMYRAKEQGRDNYQLYTLGER